MTPKKSCANCDALLVEKQIRGQAHLFCSNCNAYWSAKVLKRAHAHRLSPPEGSQVSLVFEDNQTSHSDLVLRVGTWAIRSDSYYFGLDHPAGTAPSAAASMRSMLLQWRRQVESATEQEPFYLPHDFSDQCTGWLRGTVRGNEIELEPGWSKTEGWSFYPSSYLEDGIVPADFSPIEELPAYRLARTDLLADIDRSVAALSS